MLGVNKAPCSVYRPPSEPHVQNQRRYGRARTARNGFTADLSPFPHRRCPNAFLHRFFGLSNFTAAGSNASGSKLPPAQRRVDSCS